MKILHITPSFFPATYWGGPIFSTLGLCDSLAKLSEVELQVLTTDTSGPKKEDHLEGVRFPTRFPEGYLVYYCRKTFGKEFSIDQVRYIIAMVRWADVVHLHYAYSPPTIPTLLVCRLIGRPVVWSPNGAFQRWQGTKRHFAKRIWEIVCNSLISRKSTITLATSKEEAKSNTGRIPNAPAAIIPHGVVVVPVVEERVWMPEHKLRIMYLGRLHPIKGIENLLGAMPLLIGHVDAKLELFGGGEPNYRKILEKQIKELNIEDRVKFHGPVSGEAKEAAFANSDVFVLPSFTENFGMVVAEALSHNVPVVASKGTPWGGLEKHNCGLWVENTPESIASALHKISCKNLEEMGKNGRSWMLREYTWSCIADTTLQLYKDLIKKKI